MQARQQAPLPAKFTHDSGFPRLRLQAFVAVRDAERRILCLKSQGGWMLPGVLLVANESPDDAARRAVATFLRTPLQLWLSEALNFPATGPEDDKWYLVLLYEADAPASLATAPGIEETRFVKPGEAPGPWAMSHQDIFDRLGA
ncbi:MAG TPA: NUDIX hydrolase [Candidatus Thermoplasmatota archaeon]|nr:NUDIX hydrolase [Candidatus Thermoplasmatota archaeon]